MGLRSFAVALIMLLSAGSASAGLKISLVTVSLGTLIFESFGYTFKPSSEPFAEPLAYTALIAEDADASPSTAIVYRYGTIDATQTLLQAFSKSDPMDALVEFFDSKKVKTSASKIVSPMVDIGTTGHRLPMVLKSWYLSPNSDQNREVTITPLDLTEEQAKKLVKMLDDDIAAGEYVYDNYNNNYVTKIRDRLYDDAVLGKEQREAIESDKSKFDTSIQQLVFESIDETIKNSPEKKADLMPNSVLSKRQGRKAMKMLGALGFQPSYKDSKKFLEAIISADSQLQGLLPDEAITKGFHNYFFAPSLTEKPITESRTMFLPKHLRQGLLHAMNPATGKPLVDPATEFRRSTLEERMALAAARPIAQQPQPQQSVPAAPTAP